MIGGNRACFERKAIEGFDDGEYFVAKGGERVRDRDFVESFFVPDDELGFLEVFEARGERNGVNVVEATLNLAEPCLAVFKCVYNSKCPVIT